MLSEGVRVHLHPSKVEFFRGAEKEPYSRLPYGVEGSDAFAQATAEIAKLESVCDVETVRFDAQGREVGFSS